jgi:hypothetical protein
MLDDVWWRGVNFIRRAICQWPAGRYSIIPSGTRGWFLIEPLDGVCWYGLTFIGRTIYRAAAGGRSIIPLGTRVRLGIKRRLPQRIVRLERGV